MLKTRLITATIFVSLIVYNLSFSPATVFMPMLLTMIFVIILLAGTEYAALTWNLFESAQNDKEERRVPPIRVHHVLVGLSYALALPMLILGNQFFDCSQSKNLIFMLAFLIFSLIASCYFIYRLSKNLTIATFRFLAVLAGHMYLVLPSLCLFKIAYTSYGSDVRGAAVYFCFAVTLMGDTGAYFAGRLFGKHKLAPDISPKKTWEGAFGGLIFSGLTAALLGPAFGFPFSIIQLILIGIISGTVGQIGDLLESALKRTARYKDSGKLLPGHGGFLDRIDSLILGLPVTYIFFSLFSN